MHMVEVHVTTAILILMCMTNCAYAFGNMIFWLVYCMKEMNMHLMRQMCPHPFPFFVNGKLWLHFVSSIPWFWCFHKQSNMDLVRSVVGEQCCLHIFIYDTSHLDFITNCSKFLLHEWLNALLVRHHGQCCYEMSLVCFCGGFNFSYTCLMNTWICIQSNLSKWIHWIFAHDKLYLWRGLFG